MDREKLRDIFRKYRAVGLVLLAGLSTEKITVVQWEQ